MENQTLKGLLGLVSMFGGELNIEIENEFSSKSSVEFLIMNSADYAYWDFTYEMIQSILYRNRIEYIYVIVSGPRFTQRTVRCAVA